MEMEQFVKHLEARVTSLEDKDRSRESVILDLRREVIYLQKENFNLRREVTALKDKRSAIESEVISLKDKVKNLKGISKDLSDFKKLRSLFNHMVVKAHGQSDSGRQSSTGGSDACQQLERRVQKLERRSTAGGSDACQQLERRVQRLERRIDDTNCRLDDVEESQQAIAHQNKKSRAWKNVCRCIPRTGRHKQEIESMLHKPLAMASSKMFLAHIKPSQDMVEGVRNKLDVCVGELHNVDGWFDTQSCCLVPKRDCEMALGWRMCQSEEGELCVYLLGDVLYLGADYLGKTTSDGDVCQGVTLRHFQKEHKYWFEVERTQGEADVYWCNVMACVVG